MRINLQNKVFIITSRCRQSAYRIITDKNVRSMYQVNAAMNTSKTPEILIFQVGTVTISVNFQ